ncbi:hypothetical protein APR41_10480 [Salegentibacter salinarum]|uniref:HTH araC/xylS-type domain-containing protein n=1 Tax=Salegentibacter salinarum TaxID=447422 RepID=A0A2N0TNA1_9FLAO|nr:AraC family transcriptional regulator [Salegentibacter salinarum]PKD16204.1 hypothetical protein APR41_10480 [Salegentibacter salinarum]SKB67969.1 AraC-type DNA-binding protein [Salegentibacter salinarum]
MLVIKVNAIPLDDVMLDLGKAFGVEVEETCKELKLKLPTSLGTGNISGIQFPNGLGFIQYDCKFHKNTEIHFIKSEVHPLKFIYVTEGQLKHRFSNGDQLHKIDQYQHAIVASEKNNGHILKFEKGKETCFSSIELNRIEFEQKLACKLLGVSSSLTQVFYDVKALNSFYHNGYYSLKIADLFEDMNSYKKENFIRKLFLEAFTIQMLAEEILQYEDALREEGNAEILTRYELGAVKDAAEFIEENIFKNLVVRGISIEVGINQNKLQNGFKTLYGLTVHDFIKRHRLQLVRDLLLNTDLQINEISDRVGINSKSYFSKVFKEKYGLTPKEFKKKAELAK